MKRSIQKPLEAFFKTTKGTTKRNKVEGGRIWRMESELEVFKQDIACDTNVYIHRENLEVENTTLIKITTNTNTNDFCIIKKRKS